MSATAADAIPRLCVLHGTDVRIACRRLCGDPDLAADAAQETFARALEAAAEGRYEDRDDGALPWLLGIARRCAASERRAARRLRTEIEREGDAERERRVLPSTGAVEVLADLPERERTAFEVRHAGAATASYAEVGATLGCSGTTARRLCVRAERTIRRNLKELV